MTDAASATMAEWGEFGFIAALRERLPQAYGDLKLGVGDDAAWWCPTVGQGILTTTDMLVEGVHFDLSYTSAAALGYKSLAVNLSDLAAMGGRPACVYLSLALPARLEKVWLETFIEAFLASAKEYDVQLAGGDTVQAQQLVLSVTLCGLALAPPLQRRGAAVGDDIYLSGTCGDSYLGLKLLQGTLPAGLVSPEAAAFLKNRHLRPVPRVALGEILAASGSVSAMLDVSDGVVGDLNHLLTAAGGLGAELEAARLPLSFAARGFLEANLTDYVALLTGGEDYELLFTAAPGQRDIITAIADRATVSLTRIGRITPTAGIFLLAEGKSEALNARGGYDHFQHQGC
ncbi:MAG: thiamine-phosphate kinase [Deltaproteobacteria bacterium]|nr:thiamine-phosphate kinase [Deltaproteobacteria bacterium]